MLSAVESLNQRKQSIPPQYILRGHRGGVSCASFAVPIMMTCPSPPPPLPFLPWICSGDVSGEIVVWSMASRRPVIRFNPSSSASAGKQQPQQQQGILFLRLFLEVGKDMPSGRGGTRRKLPNGWLVAQTRAQRVMVWRLTTEPSCAAGDEDEDEDVEGSGARNDADVDDDCSTTSSNSSEEEDDEDTDDDDEDEGNRFQLEKQVELAIPQLGFCPVDFLMLMVHHGRGESDSGGERGQATATTVGQAFLAIPGDNDGVVQWHVFDVCKGKESQLSSNGANDDPQKLRGRSKQSVMKLIPNRREYRALAVNAPWQGQPGFKCGQAMSMKVLPIPEKRNAKTQDTRKHQKHLLSVGFESGHVVLYNVEDMSQCASFRPFTEPMISLEVQFLVSQQRSPSSPPPDDETCNREPHDDDEGQKAVTDTPDTTFFVTRAFCASAEGTIHCYDVRIPWDSVLASRGVSGDLTAAASSTLLWQYVAPKGIGEMSLLRTQTHRYSTDTSNPSVLAVGGWDSRVRLLQTRGEQVLSILTHHKDSVHAVDFGADFGIPPARARTGGSKALVAKPTATRNGGGRQSIWLVSASGDGTVAVWLVPSVSVVSGQ